MADPVTAAPAPASAPAPATPAPAAAPVTPTPTPPPAPPPKPVRPTAPAAAPVSRPSVPPTPTALERFGMSAQQRFDLGEAERRASDPWTDPSRLITRGPDGITPRIDGAEPAPGEADSGTAKPAAPKPIRIGNDVDGYYDASESEIQAWRAEHAAAESRRLTLPTSAEAYEVKLSPDFKAPEAFKDWRPQADHPLMAQVKQLAHEAGLTQQQFERLLSLSAAKEIGTAQMLQTARDAEVAKLGANGVNRVTAVENFISAHAGEELFKATKPLLATAAAVQVWERVINAFSGTGPRLSGNRSSERSRPQMDDATWNKMSYGEKNLTVANFPSAEIGADRGRANNSDQNSRGRAQRSTAF
jgi:hypothetical protein